MESIWRWRAQHKSLVNILALAFVLRLIWILLVPVQPISDSGVYDLLARNIANGTGFAWAPGVPTAHWPVGPAFVYAVFYWIFGLSYVPILIFHIVISLGTIWLSMLLAERWFNRTTAIFTGYIMALWPVQIEFTSVLASELIFNFLLVAWLAVWELVTINRWAKAILLGVIAAATCYIRPVGLLIPIILCVLEMIRARKILRPAVSTAIIFLVMAILIAPWSIRNTRIFGHFVQISTNGGVNLWEGNNPTGEGQTEAIPPDALRMQEADRDIYLGKIAKDYIKQYPGRFVVRTLKKAVWLNDHETIGVHWNILALVRLYGERVLLPLKIVSDIYWWVVLFFGLIGVCVVFAQRGIWEAATSVPIVMWCYFTALYSVFVVQDRYHFSSLPFIAILAGTALYALREYATQRSLRQTARLEREVAPR